VWAAGLAVVGLAQAGGRPGAHMGQKRARHVFAFGLPRWTYDCWRTEDESLKRGRETRDQQ